jgi:hypothetical protein
MEAIFACSLVRWSERGAEHYFGRPCANFFNAINDLQVGLLTVYDMCKAIDRGMVIEGVRLLEKHGGKSGSWVAPE